MALLIICASAKGAMAITNAGIASTILTVSCTTEVPGAMSREKFATAAACCHNQVVRFLSEFPDIHSAGRTTDVPCT